jgi:hypothetical protein
MWIVRVSSIRSGFGSSFVVGYFLIGEEFFSGKFCGTLEWRRGAVVPDALKIGTACARRSP